MGDDENLKERTEEAGKKSSPGHPLAGRWGRKESGLLRTTPPLGFLYDGREKKENIRVWSAAAAAALRSCWVVPHSRRCGGPGESRGLRDSRVCTPLRKSVEHQRYKSSSPRGFLDSTHTQSIKIYPRVFLHIYVGVCGVLPIFQ